MNVFISLDTQVTCPKFNHTFLLKEGITEQVLNNLVSETKGTQQAEMEEVKKQTRKDAERENAVLLDKLNKKLEDGKALELKRFSEQQVQYRELLEEKEAMALKVTQAVTEARKAAEKTLEKERASLRTQAEAAVRAELDEKAQTLAEQKADAKAMNDSLQKLRAEFKSTLEEKAALKQAVNAAELKAAKEAEEKIEKETQRIREELTMETRLQLQKKDKTIEDLKLGTEEMRRKIEQGSMQAQGESAEVILFQDLDRAFASDLIEDVKTGARGADIMQQVRNPRGRQCGAILWESKDTKAWQSAWLEKLELDRLAAAADLAVLVTRVFPSEHAEKDMFQQGNIWVVKPGMAVYASSFLREVILQVFNQKSANLGREDRAKVLFDVISDRNFASQFQNVFDLVDVMQDCLDKESRAIQKHWNKRQATIQKLTRLVGQMLGDLCAAGKGTLKDLEQVAGLELLDEQETGDEDQDINHAA